MELVTPGLGLIVWMLISFSILLFILGKFAWPSITKALKEREATIEDALQLANKTREEMKTLQAHNEKLLVEAKEERDAMLRDARKMKDGIIDEAREKANKEYNRILESSREAIHNEKMAAMVELKNQLAQLSIEIAETILREKLKDPEKQSQYLTKLINEAKFN